MSLYITCIEDLIRLIERSPYLRDVYLCSLETEIVELDYQEVVRKRDYRHYDGMWGLAVGMKWYLFDFWDDKSVPVNENELGEEKEHITEYITNYTETKRKFERNLTDDEYAEIDNWG